jgi:hypothetical protein
MQRSFPTFDRHLDSIADRVARALAPAPPPRPLEAFVATLRPGEGRNREEAKRKLNPRAHAAQWYVTRAFDSNRYRTILTIGPSGDGKSLCTINAPIMHALFERQIDLVYSGPTRQLLNKLYRTKLRRMIVSSGYGSMLPREGPGSAGGVADDIRFANGTTLFPIGGGGKGESAQAGVHAPLAFYEEYDDMDAHEIELVAQRTSAHGLDSMHVKTTTIKRDQGSRTIEEFWHTTRCRIQFACIRCDAWQIFRWERVKAADWMKSKVAVETVAIECEHCHAMLTAAEHRLCLDRHRLVSVTKEGEISLELPDVDSFGLWWSSLDSPRKGLEYLADKYSKALVKRELGFNHEAMRQFWRDELAAPYEDEDLGQRAAITDELISTVAAAATYRRGEIPPEAQVLGIGQDCQLRSHYWIAVAFAWDRELHLARWWIVDWGEISVCGAADLPTVTQRHAALDQVDALLERGYPVKGTDRMMVGTFGGCDTAYYPREVRPWIARHRRRWMSMRGCGADQFGSMRGETRRGTIVQSVKDAIVIYEQPDAPDRLQGFAERDQLNDAIETGLQGGTGWVPQDCDNRLAFHLRGIRRGGPDDKDPWVEVHRRHDWRDGLVYDLARAYQFFNHPPPAPRATGILGSLIRR